MIQLENWFVESVEFFKKNTLFKSKVQIFSAQRNKGFKVCSYWSRLYVINDLCSIWLLIQLENRSGELAVVLILAILSSLQAGVLGIRFVIDREECFSHNVEYATDTIHSSFVVIKSEGSWHYSPEGVDLVVKALFFYATYLSILWSSIFYADILLVLNCIR